MSSWPSLAELRDELPDDVAAELGPASDPDTISDVHGGDVCPLCGEALKNTRDDLVRSDGAVGRIWDLARDDASVPVFCPDCWREVEAAANRSRNRQLAEWADGGA